jgi:hypothetical protein
MDFDPLELFIVLGRERGILCILEEYHSDLPILKSAQSRSNMRPNAFLALRPRDLERLHPPWYGGAMFASLSCCRMRRFH